MMRKRVRYCRGTAPVEGTEIRAFHRLYAFLYGIAEALPRLRELK